MATKVAQALLEYGINSSRLVMPTRENLLHLESLIDATTLLLEVKRNVDRVEQEIRVMKARVLRRDEQLGGGDGGETPMDVDQEVVADEDDAGVHPGRSARKKNVSFFIQEDLGTGFWLTFFLHYRPDDPCRYLPLTPQPNPDGQTKGRNRVKFPSCSRSHILTQPSCTILSSAYRCAEE